MEISKSYQEVRKFLREIEESVDADDNAFGFMPKSVYEEQSQRGRLWVAHTNNQDYIGHLLFGGKFPQLRVVQLHVGPNHRGQGVGRKLIDSLVTYGESNDFYSIQARVGTDLPANAFWERVGFKVTRVEEGGRTTERKINVRVRQLNVRTLFELAGEDFDVFPEEPISYEQIPSLELPKYSLDLNVIIDLVRGRSEEDAAATVLRSAMHGHITLAMTTEARKELSRASIPSTENPLLRVVATLPTLPEVSGDLLSQTIEALRVIIFPGRSLQRRRAGQDQSDLTHLALCIHHGIDGFVTRDKALLRAAEDIQRDFDLDVLSTQDFSIVSDISPERPAQLVANAHPSLLTVRELGETDRRAAEEFLSKEDLSAKNVKKILQPDLLNARRNRIGGWVGSDLVAIATWNVPPSFAPEVSVFLVVAENAPKTIGFVDHVLGRVSAQIPFGEMRRIVLHYLAKQSSVEATAAERGFRSDPRTVSGLESVVRIAIARQVTEEMWSDFRDSYCELSSLRLPPQMPDSDELSRRGVLLRKRSGDAFRARRFDFDTTLSPGLLLPADQGGVVVPIRRGYAAQLLGDALQQQPLIFRREAHMRLERAYFRSALKASLFKKGIPVYFYVSGSHGGDKAIIASARVTATLVGTVDEVRMKYWRQGVLDRREMLEIAGSEGRLHAFTFDSVLIFPHPVPYRTLREHKCISGANLVTAEEIEYNNLLKVNHYAANGLMEAS